MDVTANVNLLMLNSINHLNPKIVVFGMIGSLNLGKRKVTKSLSNDSISDKITKISSITYLLNWLNLP